MPLSQNVSERDQSPQKKTNGNGWLKFKSHFCPRMSNNRTLKECLTSIVVEGNPFEFEAEGSTAVIGINTSNRMMTSINGVAFLNHGPGKRILNSRADTQN
jgi:hypothetical protein